MKEIVLLTGGTGFLGREIADRIVRTTDSDIYVLVRAENKEEAYHRLRAFWYPYRALYEALGERVFPVCGDITKKDLGMAEEDRTFLCENVSRIFHTAADVSLMKSETELMRINRDGTEALLSFAKEIKGLQRFVHVSTAYVSGTRTGLIKEEDAPALSFSSLYEKSKAAGENFVRMSGLPYTVVRPGMIVGNRETGRVKNFNTVYYMLKLMLTGKLNVIPVRKDLKLNIIPVDCVAEDTVKLGYAEEALGNTYHLTTPEAYQPTVKELYDYVREWSRKNLDYDPGTAVYASVPVTKAGKSYNLRTNAKKKNYVSNLLALSPYFEGKQTYDRSGTDSLCGAYTLNWRDYIDTLLAYACRRNFMNDNGHTVFEQAQVRRNSTKYPMHYHDVSSTGISTVSGQEVNKQVERIVDALYAWGIRKGDRVALTGINSIEYMELDMALGLSGIVTVPIYYTTPAEEAEVLLRKSGAQWFFVGDRRIMKDIEKIGKDIRIVVFSDGLKVHKSGVMHMEQFLYEAKEKAPKQYVEAEELATIRYTSGTTGDPKGVKFNFAQLAWMGEVLTNLLPWKERNDKMRYLSFLPLSHVVEGILASYAPYYVLADVDFYFLNDFGALTEALPKVRPTVFFSVPRFYEKLWDQLTANKYGKKWLAMSEGPAKEALGRVLKTVILRKAGLDACQQLIVGSAPISEALLQNFRRLGIEIYNAYGQAEAPLITINRMHDNVIPTIGTPLPETEVWAAEDGELIVKGPQVCLGYYGLETDTIKDGVLKTGDLGTIGEDGHIALFGRKKEMIITAYGKNISIPKIEERLKNIIGITEAVLIGERRPYCTALLWTDREIPDLDAEIKKMNEDLSHPEQIRRYTIMEKPLSIQAGELTPNLKVRRANVEKNYQNIIEEMYR